MEMQLRETCPTDAEFVDDPTAPQYWIDDLQDVIIRGTVCEIIPYTFRRTSGGVWIKVPSHTCLTTLGALPRMAALVMRKAGGAAISSTLQATTRALGLH